MINTLIKRGRVAKALYTPFNYYLYTSGLECLVGDYNKKLEI